MKEGIRSFASVSAAFGHVDRIQMGYPGLVDQVQRLIPCDVTHESRSAQEQRATDGYHLSDPVH